jgi:hypothetical protein
MAADSAAPREGLSHSRIAAWWFMLAGPLLIAFAQQQAMYILSDFACRTQTRLLVHAPLLPALALVGFALVLARREWQRTGESSDSDVAGEKGLSRLFATVGFAVGGLALVVILAQWLPTLFLDPCQR